MKYPLILFFRWDKYNEVDSKLEQYKEADKLDCTIKIINSKEQLLELYSTDTHILVTYGDSDQEYAYDVNEVIPKRLRGRWIHKKEIDNINEFNYNVNYCYISNVIDNRVSTRPVFSIFTSCYNSYDKLFRAYNSIKKQTMKDWEWVIMDDSPDDKHFEFLRNISAKDKRIRLYKRDQNSGSIGNVKNETIGLCRGKYVLEMDHDDEIMSYVLQDATDVFENDKDVGFVYMETASIREGGENFTYGDFICKGYGGNYTVKHDGKWRVIYNTPNINNITLSHLVCLPNHPRIWRRTTLMECGSYSELLPICDDFEVLLRTCINTKVVKIPKLGYFQYMNANNNNFSLIRNAEINRIGPQYISPMFFDRYKVNDKMKELDAFEDESYNWEHSKLWKRENSYTHKFCNQLINNDFDRHFCLIGLQSLSNARIKKIYENPRNDIILLDNKVTTEQLQKEIDRLGYDRMRCYSMNDCSEYELIKFFKRIYKFKEEYEIIADNLPTRDSIINVSTEKMMTLPEDEVKCSYLEIGVEYGHTFNGVQIEDKVGVDPDPKFEHDALIKKTSDDFFATNTKMFDRIFIDGMHHSDFVVRDFNNSMKFLREDGIIYIDDIVPANEREQLKIPPKHYYENGILKYGESWTGDVWKVVHYIMQHHRDKFDFTLHQGAMYRGVGCFKIKTKFTIPESAVSEIENYSFDLFEQYKSSLLHVSSKKYKYNLSVCAVFKNEARVLNEWIQHYLAEGVDHFYLINNNSSDHYLKVLDRYMKKGLITLKNCNDEWSYADAQAHKHIFNRNVYQHRFETKWMIMVDLDEFMYGRKNRTIAEYLDTLDDDIGNIYVEWRFFGSNGHQKHPGSLVKNLTTRVKYRSAEERPRWNEMPSQVYFTCGFGKSIFRSAWMHDEPKFWMHKVYTSGKRIDNYGNEMPSNFYDPDNILLEGFDEEKVKEANLGLNHYVVQSKNDLLNKILVMDRVFKAGNHPHIQRKGFLVGCHYIETHPELLIEDRELADKRQSWSDDFNKRHHSAYHIEDDYVSIDGYGDFFVYKNCGVCSFLKSNQKWEEYMHPVFEKYITEDSVVIEAGCHVGSHSVRLAQLAKKVHYFEPLESSFEILSKNLELNIENSAKYEIHKNGAGEKFKETSFAWIPNNNIGGTGLDDNPQGIPNISKEVAQGEWFNDVNKQKVEVVPIDSLNLEKLDFMKVDVEGYEPFVIQGAMETIKKCRPVIIMECFKDHNGNVSTVEELEEKYKELIDIGYRVEFVSGPDYLFIPNTNIYEIHKRFEERSMEQLHDKFIGNDPFDHIILEDMIDPIVLGAAEQEIRNERVQDWLMHFVHGQANVQVNKFCKSTADQCGIYMCGPYSTAISVYFSSKLFIEWTERLTDIPDLQNDPENVGGGIHRITSGGKLGIHADYNRNPKSKKYRRVNTLLYLNRDWKPGFNGELELWSKDMTECVVSVPPVFNKMVIFRINDDAYHGHPLEWKPTFDYHRVSFAFYYFTDDRPEHEKSESYNAQWQKINIIPGKDPYARVKEERQRLLEMSQAEKRAEENVNIKVNEVETIEIGSTNTVYNAVVNSATFPLKM